MPMLIKLTFQKAGIFVILFNLCSTRGRNSYILSKVKFWLDGLNKSDLNGWQKAVHFYFAPKQGP